MDNAGGPGRLPEGGGCVGFGCGEGRTAPHDGGALDALAGIQAQVVVEVQQDGQVVAVVLLEAQLDPLRLVGRELDRHECGFGHS